MSRTVGNSFENSKLQLHIPDAECMSENVQNINSRKKESVCVCDIICMQEIVEENEPIALEHMAQKKGDMNPTSPKET